MNCPTGRWGGFKDGDGMARLDRGICCGQTGHSGADDYDLCHLVIDGMDQFHKTRQHGWIRGRWHAVTQVQDVTGGFCTLSDDVAHVSFQYVPISTE